MNTTIFLSLLGLIKKIPGMLTPKNLLITIIVIFSILLVVWFSVTYDIIKEEVHSKLQDEISDYKVTNKPMLRQRRF